MLGRLLGCAGGDRCRRDDRRRRSWLRRWRPRGNARSHATWPQDSIQARGDVRKVGPPARERALREGDVEPARPNKNETHFTPKI